MALMPAEAKVPEARGPAEVWGPGGLLTPWQQQVHIWGPQHLGSIKSLCCRTLAMLHPF